MCSGSKEGSCSRLIDFAHHSTLGLSVMKKTKRNARKRTRKRNNLLDPRRVHGKRKHFLSETGITSKRTDAKKRKASWEKGRQYGKSEAD